MYEIKYKIGKNRTLKTVYERQNLWSKGGNRQIGRCFIGKYETKNYIQRQKIRSATVTELIENNFESGKSTFITLTFGNELVTVIDDGYRYKDYKFKDIKICNKEFKKFIQRLKYRFHDIKYVAVIEVQNLNKRNIFHYHMVCNIPYIEHKELLQIWGNGSVWIKETYDIEGLASYMTKDMGKITEHILKREKGYLCSKGLKRDIIVRSWCLEERDLYLKIKELLKDKKAIFVRRSINEFAGSFEYIKFQVKSDLF